MRTGQVVGRSNRYGEHAVERPVKFGGIYATLYKSARLDIGLVRIIDRAGVPQHLFDKGSEPMHELV
jgi:hypothetical protein